MIYVILEAVTRGVLYTKMFLKILQNSQENTCTKNETVAQVFSCEFYGIFKNTFFKEHLRKTASAI